MKKFLFLCMALLFMGCQSHRQPDPRIVHVVLTWLNEPTNEKHRNMVIKASEEFLKIPGVLDVGVGRPLMSDRDIVDDSFDVGIFLTFKTEEDFCFVHNFEDRSFIVHGSHAWHYFRNLLDLKLD